MKTPKNLGKIITNVSFILLSLAMVIVVGGRIFAQSSAQIDISYGKQNDDTKITNLDTSYVDSNAALATFTQGQKCDRADNACVIKTTDNNRLFNAMFMAIGNPDAGSGETSNSSGTSSLFNTVGKMISWTYEKPAASGTYYVAEALDNIGLAPATYAQGYGYYALSPYLQIWRVFRNLAYIFFTVVVIVIGILILFRQRIGGQAAVTAQQALPRIVLALLLVTFSYAIAGFMIDLMYWIMYAFASFINVNNLGGATTSNELVNGGFGALFKMIFFGNFGSIWTTVSSLTGELFSGVGDAVLGVVGKFLGDVAGGIAGFLASFIVIIVLFTNLFRLLFILLKSYAIILLNVIFAPVNLMLTAIPGINTFKKWIMSIIANLSPFVVTFFMIAIMGVTNSVFGGTSSSSGQGFVPPYTLSPTSGSFTTSSIGTLVGLAIMLAMPQIVESVKKKLDGGGGFFSEVASAATDNFKKGQQTGKKVASGARAVAAPIAGGIWGMTNQQKLIERGELDPEAKGRTLRAVLIGGTRASQGNKDFKIRNAIGARVVAGLGGARTAVRQGAYGYVEPEYQGASVRNSSGQMESVANYLDETGTTRQDAIERLVNATDDVEREKILKDFGSAVAMSKVYRSHKYNSTDIKDGLSASDQKQWKKAIKDLNKRSAAVLGGNYSGTNIVAGSRMESTAQAAANLREKGQQEFKEKVNWAKQESLRKGGMGNSMLEQKKYDDSRAREADMTTWSQYVREAKAARGDASKTRWLNEYGKTLDGFENWRRTPSKIKPTEM